MNNVIFTKVSIFRNLKDYKFVPKLDAKQKEEIVSKLENAFKGKLSLLNLANADEKVINSLKAGALIQSNVSNFFVGKENVAVNLFDGEHLTIVASCDGFNSELFNRAKEVADLLASKINLAFNDEFGFLMSDLAKIGAGLKFESQICLDSLRAINKIEQVKQNVRKLGYVLKETKTARIYTISTICNLGFSEKEICDEFGKMLAKLQDLEVESAKMLDVSNHDELLDKALRSFAILNSAYLMNYDELNKLLINIRTGLNLGLININAEKLMRIQKLSTNKNSEIVSQSELKELAEQVKNILKGE